jgi:hypothetical protein
MRNKKAFAGILAIVIFTWMMVSLTNVISLLHAGIPLSTAYTVKVVITNAGVYQTGLAANTALSIMRNSDSYWLDFTDNTFKASGHTTISTTLAENTDNPVFSYYYYRWTLPSGETNPNIYSFFAKCTGATKMYAAQDISYDRITFYFGQ